MPLTMSRRNNHAETCSECGARITWDDALYDEHVENYFCDLGCFRDWADHTQRHLIYYVSRNVVNVDLSESNMNGS